MAIRTVEEALEVVKQNGCELQFVPEHLKTEAVCMVAVKQDGMALKYVPSAMRTSTLVDMAARQIVSTGDIFVSPALRAAAERVVH